MYTSAEVQLHFHTIATGTDAALIKRANEYLLGFQASADAWGICRSLLVPETQPHILLMAIQNFYQKIRSEWHMLKDDQRIELRDYLLTLPYLAAPPNVHRKVCQCLAFSGVNLSASLWDSFYTEILSFPKVETVLEVLDCIPFIVSDLNILRKTVELIKSRIRTQAGTVLNYLCEVMRGTGYFLQALEVIKDWKELGLPLLAHRGIADILLR